MDDMLQKLRKKNISADHFYEDMMSRTMFIVSSQRY